MSTAAKGIPVGPPHFKIAVHALVWLAKSNGVLSSAMIASQVDTHATFLRRVMQSLTSAGIVKSRGGREGGYILNKSAHLVSLGDIYLAVNTVTEPEFDVDCGKAGEQLDLELEKILFESELRTIEYLKQFTILDLLNKIDHFV
ncbi:iron-responsive transcriptional regulator [compost metagenome]